MRTLGLIGGMSWESSAHYYRLLNQGVRERHGGMHSAPLLVGPDDSSVPLFDTTVLHAAAGVDFIVAPLRSPAQAGVQVGRPL